MKMKDWDVCPECGARRIAVCRFCNTIGDNFPLADLGLILPPEHAESVAERYNSKEDQYDDGEEASIAAKPFLADALGSAFAGNGIQIETEKMQEDAPEGSPDAEKEHACKCHDTGKEGDASAEHSCKCQSSSPKKPHELVTLSHPLDLDPEVAEDAEEFPLAVMCPCCDELLYPQFLNACRTCGHQFQDGVDLESFPDAHFYDPDEDDKEDEWEDDCENDDSEEDGEKNNSRDAGTPGPMGCCLSLLCVTAAGLFWFLA